MLGDDKRILNVRCDCGHTHFACFDYYRFEDPKGFDEYFEISITDNVQPSGLKEKFSFIWKVIKGETIDIGGIYITKEDLVDIHEWSRDKHWASSVVLDLTNEDKIEDMKIEEDN